MVTSPARPVVAGIDGSAAGLAAARLAAAEAVLHRRPLRLLSTDPTPAVKQLRDSHPALTIESETFSGDLADLLVDRSRAAHVVVLAAHHDHATEPRPADPISAHVAAHAHCPVLASPAESVRMAGPVLLGVNDEAEEPTVIAYAYTEALVRGAELHAVHVWSQLPDEALSTVDPFAYDEAAAAADADRLLAEALAGWCSRYPDVAVRRRPLHHPNAAHTMLRLSADAALMVVSARHHAGHSGLLLGSVTGALIGRTYCPLTVVPAHCGWPARDSWPAVG